MGLSIPVAFQKPEPVTLLGLMLFLYFLPLMQKKYHSFSPTTLTGKIPRIILIDVDLFDELNRGRFLLDLSAKIEPDQFFVGRMEPESGKGEVVLCSIAGVELLEARAPASSPLALALSSNTGRVSRCHLYGHSFAAFREGEPVFVDVDVQESATPLVTGLSVAAAALGGRYLIRAYNAYKVCPSCMRRFYEGGFKPVMNRREAALILGVRLAAVIDDDEDGAALSVLFAEYDSGLCGI
ncbi:Mitochondrial import inner membrane translocase subunit [Nymphaea thermarum]|nr:Mitochondrial import inner membrane translocase subunit [Nymphaea thermarum]